MIQFDEHIFSDGLVKNHQLATDVSIFQKTPGCTQELWIVDLLWSKVEGRDPEDVKTTNQNGVPTRQKGVISIDVLPAGPRYLDGSETGGRLESCRCRTGCDLMTWSFRDVNEMKPYGFMVDGR